MRLCTYPECGRPLHSRGFCQRHYWQDRRGEALRPLQAQRKQHVHTVCEFDGCDRHATRRGLCTGHGAQRDRGAPLTPLGLPAGPTPQCSFEGCGRPAKSRGLCQTHYRQHLRGKPLTAVHVPTHRYAHSDGYVVVRDLGHPNADRSGRVMEHVKVMAELLGRPLLPGENVHHRNGVRDDNRPENLELWVSWQPKGQRVEDVTAWAEDVLRRYRPEALAAMP